MKIVVLDANAANPGDLEWSELEKLGQLSVYDRTPPEKLIERAAGAEALLTNKTILAAEHFDRLDSLKYIGVLATGYNVVDMPAAASYGVTVTNVPGYSTESVAQHVFALLLEATNAVGLHSEQCRNGDWVNSPDFCFWSRPLTELAGLTFGIIGYGAIGRAVAKIAAAFGMKVIAAGRRPFECEIAECAEMDEIFHRSDVLSLHCPLTAATDRLIDASRLAMMKDTAVLINTSRGGVLDEQAVADALDGEKLAFCCVDVLSSEPPLADNPLLTAKNCIISPHIAWATQSARRRLIAIAAANLQAFLIGASVNVVN